MTDHIEQTSTPEPGPQSLAELFHLVGRLVPDGQQVVAAPPSMTVAEAIRIMGDRNFTQLPVVAGKAVLGVFSFRSLAQRLLRMRKVPEDIGDLPVDEFVEQFQFVQRLDNWESILKYLDREDGVLVGHREQLEGILTPMDVLGYLHSIASPFVMLAEIELSLRRIIKACVDEDGLRTCIVNSLAQKYDADALPDKLQEMTFNDYVLIIGDGRNWPHFTQVFGEGEWQRKTTAQRLKQAGELRNEVFHFRREITAQDLEILSARRDWLQMKARAFEAMKAEKEAPSEETKTVKPGRKEWDEPSFFKALEEKRGPEEAAVARKLFEWANRQRLFFRWGTGRSAGSFNAVFGDESGPAILRVWTSGLVTIPFSGVRHLAPYDDEDQRLQLLRRLNTIHGVSIPSTRVSKENSFQLSTLLDEGDYEQYAGIMDGVVEEIQRAAAGGPDAPAHDDYLRVLTHIPVPRGQQQLYKALYDAGDEGLTHQELVQAMGRRDPQELSGVLGALGHRISGIPGYGEARRPGVEMVISYEPLPDGQHRMRLVPEMRAALEELDPGWLHEMTP